MNVAEFANRVTGAIGIDAATANSATSNEYTLFLSWLNEGVEQFLRKTKVFKRTASLTLTADQGDYSLDTDILAFEDAYYDPASGTTFMLQLMDSSRIREMRVMTATTTTTPKYVAYEGQVIMLYPTPASASDALHLVYVPRPASALAATADTPSATAYGGIPAEYHYAIEAYVKWKAAEHSNDAPSQNGASFRQQWEQAVVDTRIAEQRKAGMLIGEVNIGRGRNWRTYAGPGVDLGY